MTARVLVEERVEERRPDLADTRRAVDERDLAEIRRALVGRELALDDVGSGYSSLNLIHQLRPEFINRLDEDPSSAEKDKWIVFNRLNRHNIRVIARLQAGTCWINHYNITPIEPGMRRPC